MWTFNFARKKATEIVDACHQAVKWIHRITHDGLLSRLIHRHAAVPHRKKPCCFRRVPAVEGPPSPSIMQPCLTPLLWLDCVVQLCRTRSICCCGDWNSVLIGLTGVALQVKSPPPIGRNNGKFSSISGMCDLEFHAQKRVLGSLLIRLYMIELSEVVARHWHQLPI